MTPAAPAALQRGLERGPDGERGTDHWEEADADHWDDQWESMADAMAATYGDARAGHLPLQLRATVARRVAAPARVLEAGCGPAHFSVAMHALGYDAVGLDWGPKTLARVGGLAPGLSLVRGDVRASPFPDGSFDAVYSPGVCEHFVDGPDPVLLDARRVLRPGGWLFVSTPHLSPLDRWRRARAAEGAPTAPFYQYRFSVPGMGRTLDRLGFEVVEARPYGTWAGLVDGHPRLTLGAAGRAVGVLDLMPGLRRLGFACVWTARKPAGPA